MNRIQRIAVAAAISAAVIAPATIGHAFAEPSLPDWPSEGTSQPSGLPNPSQAPVDRVNKAQVEYYERLQLAARTKAQVEHDERLLRWLIDKHAR
jgi:hypothetical protein